MEQRQSGMGIASFVIAIVMGLAVFLLLAAAGVMEATTPGGMDEKSAAAILLGLMLIGSLMVCLVGLGLGLAALAQSDRIKVFAVLGTVINAFTLVGTILLIIVGTFMK
jgi:hypothetical protein